MKTELLTFDITPAVEAVKAGEIVAVPTETVYGLSANALDKSAVEKIYALKGRPDNKPMSVFVTDIDMAYTLCREVPDIAVELAERFWPGPLTMILYRSTIVPDAITCGGDTVGIRCPDSKQTLKLLELTGLPLTGTSANLSGTPELKTSADVMSAFGGRVPYIIDGECKLGVPSTVVDLTVTPYRVLREGSVKL